MTQEKARELVEKFVAKKITEALGIENLRNPHALHEAGEKLAELIQQTGRTSLE